jgi:hypothetical protein
MRLLNSYPAIQTRGFIFSILWFQNFGEFFSQKKFQIYTFFKKNPKTLALIYLGLVNLLPSLAFLYRAAAFFHATLLAYQYDTSFKIHMTCTAG